MFKIMAYEKIDGCEETVALRVHVQLEQAVGTRLRDNIGIRSKDGLV